MPPLTRSRGSAFTIVELFVAVAVFAIAMTVVLSLITMGTEGARDVQAKMSARHIAEHQLSLLRLDAAEGKRLPDVAGQQVQPGIKPGRGMDDLKCLVTVRDDDASRPGLKRVTVRVTWGQSRGREREYELESLVAEQRRN
jgi:type II secretory pathway pseudopilin PulG